MTFPACRGVQRCSARDGREGAVGSGSHARVKRRGEAGNRRRTARSSASGPQEFAAAVLELEDDARLHGFMADPDRHLGLADRTIMFAKVVLGLYIGLVVGPVVGGLLVNAKVGSTLAVP